MDTYALIDAVGGWLVNLVLWDGLPESWSPPPGTIAVPADEVDFPSLPQPPEA